MWVLGEIGRLGIAKLKLCPVAQVRAPSAGACGADALGFGALTIWGQQSGDRRDVHQFFFQLTGVKKPGHVPSVPEFPFSGKRRG